VAALGEALLAGAAALSPWEGVAVLLAIAYLLLAMRENPWCWYCAFASTAIYTALLWNVSLVMQSLLNGYYMAMAVYGWWQWRRGGEGHRGIAVGRWPWRHHAAVIAASLLLSAFSGFVLDTGTEAAWPYVDSLITWASVLATWMVAKKVLENWLYWIAIDLASLFLYFERGLVLSSALFALYTVMAVVGYFNWRASERQGRLALA
jgi:nicotinamide mononucleotide transporter